MKYLKIIPTAIILFQVISCTKSEIKSPMTFPEPDIVNQSPVAIAEGPDTIFLPLQQVISVIGHQSFDPEGFKLLYQWRQISGPASAKANDSNSMSNLYKIDLPGDYKFELMVTDKQGATAKDTIKTTVLFEQICSQQRTFIQPVIKSVTNTPDSINEGSIIGQGGQYLFFTQGFVRDPADPDGYAVIISKKVHVFNVSAGTWETAQLSESYVPNKIVSNDEYVIFAGGFLNSLQPNTRIDIFHIPTKKWGFIEMIEKRNYFSAGIIGDKIVIAGGQNEQYELTNKVDIYDISSGQWEFRTLSEPRTGMTVINDGQKLYFGGGVRGFSSVKPIYSDKIDIYDPASGQWSASVLSEPKGSMLGIALNNKIYWAGGLLNRKPETKVEIKDAFSNAIDFDCLGESGFADERGLMSFKKNNHTIGFIKPGFINLYEPALKKWSAANLPMQDPKAIFNINQQTFIVNKVYQNFKESYQVSELQF